MALKIVLAGIGLFVAFNVAMFGLSSYADSSSVGIRERARIFRSIDWYPPVEFMRTRRCGGEIDGIASLRNLSSAEEQFRAACAVDEDGDGIGEFGTFAEMSGAETPRGRDSNLEPPVVSGAFRTRTLRGEVSRGVYLLQLWLPAKKGSFVTEMARNIGAGVLDADAAETRWRCYAWPSKYDVSGLRTFFIDEAGDIWATEDARYSGRGLGPAPDAATPSPSMLVPETATTRASYTGADGNVWTKID